MYKLILVDDEEVVRKGIIKKIEWTKYGFEIVGEAENGREALELVEKTIPDVVITDIKMPFMDGLELAKEIHNKFSNVKVVVLTGFDEFEYAREAIKQNVMEYVLKPISSNELIEILIKVKNQIDEEMKDKEDLQALKEHYRESLPILKEKFLVSLISSKLTKKEVLEKSQAYHVPIQGKGYMVSVVTMDYHSIQENKKKIAFRFPEEKNLIEFGVLNICEEITGKYHLGTVFLHNNNIVIMGISNKEKKVEMMEEVIPLLEEIQRSIKKYLQFSVTVGVGTWCKDISAVSTSYKNAIIALDYRLILGSDRIIWIEDVEPKSAYNVEFDSLKEKTLSSSIKVGSEDEIEETIEQLFLDIEEKEVAFKDSQIFMLEMLTVLLKTAKDVEVELNEVFGKNTNLFVELYNFTDLFSIKEWMKKIGIEISKHITKERQDSCKLLVDKAKEYVHENYGDSDITISKICTYLHISPTYFSSIFKKETKTTFMNYLLQIRMDTAKELLRTTSLKNFEIAAKVGYSEPNYFSYSFKKYFGVSPTQYRNSSK